jgi:hypothetical protein
VSQVVSLTAKVDRSKLEELTPPTIELDLQERQTLVRPDSGSGVRHQLPKILESHESVRSGEPAHTEHEMVGRPARRSPREAQRIGFVERVEEQRDCPDARCCVAAWWCTTRIAGDFPYWALTVQQPPAKRMQA